MTKRGIFLFFLKFKKKRFNTITCMHDRKHHEHIKRMLNFIECDNLWVITAHSLHKPLIFVPIKSFFALLCLILSIIFYLRKFIQHFLFNTQKKNHRNMIRLFLFLTQIFKLFFSSCRLSQYHILCPLNKLLGSFLHF